MRLTQPIAVVAGARTPFCKAFSDMRDLSAVELGRVALVEALRRSGLPADGVGEVVIGNVAGPPDAANIARVIALKAGVPIDRVAHTVNRNCASGMESILASWQAISAGRADVVVAGGTESMSNIPLLFNRGATEIWTSLGRAKTMGQRLRALASFRPRHFKPVVGIELGLTDPACGMSMGETAEVLAKEFGITRQQQDQFALESHQKAEAAQTECFLSGEIAIVESDDGNAIQRDNGIRDGQSLEQMAKLRPIFDRRGTVTAGNSCQISDGAAAVVLMDAKRADRLPKPPLGFITDYAVAGCDPKRMGLGPVYATAKLLQKTGLQLSDFDLIEINEAFAAQVIACQRAMASKQFAQTELGVSKPVGEIDPERLNPHGGAIAIGHPVGTTGTRLVITLLRSLHAKQMRRGLATLCVGGGQGVAMVVETTIQGETK
jgi:acetyl-CoA acetyltransferase family protein